MTTLRMTFTGFLLLSISILVPQMRAASSWIWHADDPPQEAPNDPRYFRYTFELPSSIQSAVLKMSSDNAGTAYLNGKQVGQCRDWQRPMEVTVSSQVKSGLNVLAIRANNQGGLAGLVAELRVKTKEGLQSTFSTGSAWRSSEETQEAWMETSFDDAAWAEVAVIATLGDPPWGNVFQAPAATPAESLTVAPGFEVERLLSAQRGQGSWIAMTFDAQGRIIVSPQSDQDPMLRITLQDDSPPQVDAFEESKVRHAMGLLYAHDSLYINGHGPQGTGLYRWIDRNQDDQWSDDESLFLKAIRGEGEHGYHGLRLGPDGMIYMMNGNHTAVPEKIATQSPHQHYGEDHLLPRQWDANGHASGVLAPGGYIARTDPEGQQWELLLAGFRNAYDFDFNADGEMFTYDSDMEWDWGTPWYRPTRVLHCVVGGEYGWRSGTSKWPEYYPDSLPATLNIGIGSPTGVCFGTGASFPERYQKALYIMDWSYGRILAVHLSPRGASYVAAKEPFVQGRPLNVSDMAIGPDGALYFIVGGRGTQSGLYRVTYTGQEPIPSASLKTSKGLDARLLRHRLESFHGKEDPKAIAFAWPHLRSPDRWIRYAARIAVESQPVAQWQKKALEENHPQGALMALLAMARVGEKNHAQQVFERLLEIKDLEMLPSEQIQLARILQCALIRLDPPTPSLKSSWQSWLRDVYPSPTSELNQELAQLAAHFKVTEAIESSLQLIASTKHEETQLHYIFTLRNQLADANLDQLRRYFGWFNRDRNRAQHPPEMILWFSEANRSYSYGASYEKFLMRIKEEALAHTRPELVPRMSDILEGGLTQRTDQAPNPILERATFTPWTWETLESQLDQVTQGRSFTQGQLAYEAAQCGACHRFGDEGGAVGPDLTAIGSRFTPKDVLDAILHPSKVLSDQYAYETLTLTDEETLTGRIMGENDQSIQLRQNPYSAQVISIEKVRLAKRETSSVSPMPEGLIDVLSREEVFDLLAYLNAGGNRQDPAFSK